MVSFVFRYFRDYCQFGVYYIGAFNLSIALATQQSKAAKEQLQVARAEQKDLLEDLCDIEDELDTKLGIFRVHINGRNKSKYCNV